MSKTQHHASSDSAVAARARELFDAARDLDVEARAALLSCACGGDAALCAEVESLLHHYDAADEAFLKPPAPPRLPPDVADMLDEPAADAWIGRRVGRYRIVERLANGGMGQVYRARQDSPARDVAIKLMRPGVWTASVQKRFEYEAEILALLRHPNIAQIYEAGAVPPSPGVSTDRLEAIPYFVMEFIPAAAPITDFADRHSLTIRQRIELFLQACDAVQYGHQRGVIHRDLKPGNILVESVEPSDATASTGGVDPAESAGPTGRDADVGGRVPGQIAGRTERTRVVRRSPQTDAGLPGRVKVIDYGVARCTDADVAAMTLHTQVGQLIGTLQYMSPEQCSGDPHDVDTRTDVYSLGIVLYELLTGRPPYDIASTAIPQASRIICEHPPPSPATVSRALCGDIAAVILKALEKEPRRRYATAAELACDLRHVLAGEPVDAHPPTTWTRTVRWAARHPKTTTAALCGCIAALVLGGTMLSVWAFNRRPHRIVLSDDEREARLETFAGGFLHIWSGRVNGGIGTGAGLLPRPLAYGGGMLAIVPITEHDDPRYSGKLCAFDVDHSLSVPVWTASINPSSFPDIVVQGGSARRDFRVDNIHIADVFPQRKGSEILAVFTHKFSQRAICVYDCNGELLYQVWHDGSISEFQWLADEGLLVFAGDNGQRHQDRLACVVFAVRPVFGLRSRAILPRHPAGAGIAQNQRLAGPNSVATAPVWYWELAPNDTDETGALRYRCKMPRLTEDNPQHVYLKIYPTGQPQTSFSWSLEGRTGRVIPHSLVPTDAYVSHQRSHPPGDPEHLLAPNQFTLVPARTKITDVIPVPERNAADNGDNPLP